MTGQKRQVMYREHQVMFFTDLAVEVQKQRQKYNDMKRKLHQLNMGFGFLFPAKMRIVHKGTCATHQRRWKPLVSGFVRKVTGKQRPALCTREHHNTKHIYTTHGGQLLIPPQCVTVEFHLCKEFSIEIRT